MQLKSGIHDGIPFKEYLNIQRFSKSMVAPLIRSPKHLRWYLDHADADEADRKMILGNVADCLLFEPATFGSRYWTIPATYTNSKGETSAWTKQSKTCREAEDSAIKAGLTPAKSEDVEKAGCIVARISEHPLASKWLAEGKFQQTIIWTDPQTGVECKGRADIIVPGDGPLPSRIVDLKLTKSAAPAQFSRVLNEMLYHVQAAMYHDGIIVSALGEDPQDIRIPFSFIVAEYDEPFDVVCYTLDMEAMLAGRAIFHDRAQVYSDCLRLKRWPGISNDDEMIGIPAWAANRVLMDGVNQ